MLSYNLQLYFSKQILFGSWEERLFGLHETPVDDTITFLIYKFYVYMTVYLLKYIPYLTLPYTIAVVELNFIITTKAN